MKVSELIAKLQTFPKDAEAVIEDADTGWLLVLSEVSDAIDPSVQTVVKLRGDYGSIHAERYPG